MADLVITPEVVRARYQRSQARLTEATNLMLRAAGILREEAALAGDLLAVLALNVERVTDVVFKVRHRMAEFETMPTQAVPPESH